MFIAAVGPGLPHDAAVPTTVFSKCLQGLCAREEGIVSPVWLPSMQRWLRDQAATLIRFHGTFY